MKSIKYSFLILISAAAFAAAQDLAEAEKPKAFKPAVQTEQQTPQTSKATRTIPAFKDLTLDQKLAQSVVIAINVDSANKYKDAIEKGLVGGVLIQWGNYSIEQTKELISKLQGWAAKSPSAMPLLIAIDYEGGTVYTPVTLGLPYLPTNMLLAAANDEESTITLFYLVANQLKSAGVNVNFSPVVDVNINPANPIIGVRSFGSNPALVGKMGVALVTGMQSAGIMAVAKHFPGHGETYQDSHLALPHLLVDESEFRRVHLPPFKQAIDSGVMGVMTAHIVYDFMDKENPATFSRVILNDLLKKELGFKGIVISDSLDMAGASKGSNIVTAAIKSLNAGVDLILTSKKDPAETHKGINAQIGISLPQQRVEEAAEKIYNLKKQLGLLGEAQTPAALNAYKESFEFYAKKLTQEGVSVVRAQENIIPYSKPRRAVQKEDGTIEEKKQKLCLVFFSPSRFADQLPPIQTPFLQKGWQVEYFNAHMRPQPQDMERAKRCMKDADLVILGSLQWADKPIDSQLKAINELLQSEKDIILLSLMSPYDIKFYPQAKNIMALYGINKLSAQAAADIILGNITAQGKLPISLNYEEPDAATAVK